MGEFFLPTLTFFALMFFFFLQFFFFFFFFFLQLWLEELRVIQNIHTDKVELINVYWTETE